MHFFKQVSFEKERALLLTRAAVAEAQVLELQDYIDKHLGRSGNCLMHKSYITLALRGVIDWPLLLIAGMKEKSHVCVDCTGQWRRRGVPTAPVQLSIKEMSNKMKISKLN